MSRINREDWGAMTSQGRRLDESVGYGHERLEVISEKRHDHGMREFHVRQSGVARTLNGPALNALGELLTDTFHRFNSDYEGDNRGSMMRQFKDIIYRNLQLTRTQNLSQMASDKVRPLFWAALCSRAEPMMRYERENAKECLNAFKQRHGLSNADWKFLCGKPHYYLYMHFSQNGPYNIRWPSNLVGCETRNRPEMSMPDLCANMKKLFADNDSRSCWPDKHAFDSVMSDLIDGLRGIGDAGALIMWRVFSSENWDTFHRRVREIENNHARGVYGRSPAMAHIEQFRREYTGEFGIEHYPLFGFDPGRFHTGESFSAAKPEKTEEYAWLKPELPRTGEAFGGKFKFTLIDDTMKLYEEGTRMRHCIWRLYQGKFRDGKYIAYHIDAQHLSLHGLTCGFHQKGKIDLSPGAINYADIDEMMRGGVPKDAKTKDNKWALDQVKGVSNATFKDKELDAVANMLLEFVNKFQPIEEEKNEEKPKSKATDIVNAAIYALAGA